MKPEVEATPPEWRKATIRQISYLGAEEVRDLRLVPAKQLIAFPKRTAGQVKALEQRASSRVRWTIQPGREAYFSFIPLGTLNGCACVYLVGVREGPDKLDKLYRLDAEPVGPISPAAVEVDLSPYAGRRIDLLIQIEGSAAHAPGQPVPSVLWGSPAVYSRKALPALPTLPAGQRGENRTNVLLIGFDTLRADALGAWGRNPSLTPALDRLAEQSDVWLDAFSTFNVTNPSFASILTGLYGKNHGVYDLQTPLPQTHTTLAELLGKAGYDTLALISASHLGDHNSGLGQGFAEVSTASEHYAAEMPVDMTMDWLAARAGKAARSSSGSISSIHTRRTLRRNPTRSGSGLPLRPDSRRSVPGSPSARRSRGGSSSRSWAPTAISMTARWPISTARSAVCSTSWRAAGCWKTPSWPWWRTTERTWASTASGSATWGCSIPRRTCR